VREDDLEPVAEESGDFDENEQLDVDVLQRSPYAYKRSAVAQPKRRSVGARKKSALLTVSAIDASARMFLFIATHSVFCAP
jgi:hypothetical protein